MKRGLKGKAQSNNDVQERLVTTVTPMKRGLKVRVRQAG